MKESSKVSKIVDEHPWTALTTEEPPNSILIMCAKPEERAEIIKGFKKTVIFRKIKAVPINDNDCTITFKTEKRRDSAFKVLMLGMKATDKVLGIK